MSLEDEVAATRKCSVATALEALDDDDKRILGRWLRADTPTDIAISNVLARRGLRVSHKSVRRHRVNGGECHMCNGLLP